MKITAITRFKHAEVWRLLQKLGWSQSELSRRAEIRPECLGRIVNLRSRPSVAQAEKIQRAFGEAGEYLDILEEWPETFTGLPAGFKCESTQDVDHLSIESPEAMNAIADTSVAEREAAMESITESMLSGLTPGLRRVMELRYFADLTQAQSGQILRVTKERIRQLENTARRKLRHHRFWARRAIDVDEVVDLLRS